MTVHITHILPGNAGIRQTAQRMRALARRPDPSVETLAYRILSSLPFLLRHLPSNIALAVYSYVQEHMIYTPDGDAPDAHPLERGEEGLRSPDYLVREIANYGVARGDCDDYVTFMGALLLRLGVASNIVLTSGRPDGEYDHVFLRIMTEEGPVYADAIHGAPLGWRVPVDRVTATEEIPM